MGELRTSLRPRADTAQLDAAPSPAPTAHPTPTPNAPAPPAADSDRLVKGGGGARSLERRGTLPGTPGDSGGVGLRSGRRDTSADSGTGLFARGMSAMRESATTVATYFGIAEEMGAFGGISLMKDAVVRGAPFLTHVEGAIHEFQRAHPDLPLTYEDPQRQTIAEAARYFYDNSGGASFNRAPATGDFIGGAAAQGKLAEWLAEQTANGGRTSVQAMTVRALELNQGNVTLAMGTIAEVLCNGDRTVAGQIEGLENNGKDYYRFAGAFVALQPKAHDLALGEVGSVGNIVGNPMIYFVGGGFMFLKGVVTLDADQQARGLDVMTSRLGIEDNYNKVAEFTAGFAVGLNLRP